MKRLTQKQWILIAIGTVVIAVIALLAVLYVNVWAQPTKQDFTAAKADAEQIATYSGTKLLGEFVTKVNEQSKAGKAQQSLNDSVAAEKKKVIDAVAARQSLAENIESSRVVRDKDIKKSFDTYAAQEAKYRTYIKGYVDTYPAYKSSFATCIKVFQISEEAKKNLTKIAALHRTAAKPCFKDLDIVATSPITPLANYAKEFKRIIMERQKVFDGLEKKTLDIQVANDRIKQLGADYSKNNPAEALQKFVDDARFNGELNALIDALESKAKAAK